MGGSCSDTFHQRSVSTWSSQAAADPAADSMIPSLSRNMRPSVFMVCPYVFRQDLQLCNQLKRSRPLIGCDGLMKLVNQVEHGFSVV